MVEATKGLEVGSQEEEEAEEEGALTEVIREGKGVPTEVEVEAMAPIPTPARVPPKSKDSQRHAVNASRNQRM